jgi:hypothetical protein
MMAAVSIRREVWPPVDRFSVWNVSRGRAMAGHVFAQSRLLEATAAKRCADPEHGRRQQGKNRDRADRFAPPPQCSS